MKWEEFENFLQWAAVVVLVTGGGFFLVGVCHWLGGS